MDLCDNTVITTSSPIRDQTYFITSASLKIQFNPWTEITNLCSPFTYQVKQSTFDSSGQYFAPNEVPIDSSMIQFDAATLTFTV